MFDLPQSFVERIWLLALRTTWAARSINSRASSRQIDRLANQAGLPPLAQCMRELLTTLEHYGADHLYIEEIGKPGVTGDERDLLCALRAVYRDDALAAENAVSALVPPGHTDRLIEPLRAVARSRRCVRTRAPIFAGVQSPAVFQ